MEKVIGGSAIVYTSCGSGVTTVDQPYFEQYGDWFDYMMELDEIMCGSSSGGSGTVQERNGAYYIVH